MVNLVVPEMTPRLRFTLNFIFRSELGMEWQAHYNPPAETGQPVLAYTRQADLKYPFILAHSLLFENGIYDKSAELLPAQQQDDIPQIFTHTASDLLGFDVFAAVFYMLSRYEEYLPFSPDRHGRFPASQSLAYTRQFLHRPVVNEWIRVLKQKLQQWYPGLAFRKKSFWLLPTFDVDNAFAYAHKPLLRQIASAGRDFARADFASLGERFRVLTGRQPDPYAHYHHIKDLHEKAALKPVFFFQLSQYAPYDRNLSWKNKAYRQLIRNTAGYADIGLHPGYRAGENQQVLQEEARRLQQITGQPVKRARFHFLRIRFPASFQALLKVGITEDYSLGFPEAPGFRAGTCNPFYFFDLTHNRTTNLLLYPFALMDATLQYYLKASPEEACKMAIDPIRRVQQTGGACSMLWHNEAFSDSGRWKGWPAIYARLLSQASGPDR